MAGIPAEECRKIKQTEKTAGYPVQNTESPAVFL